MMARTWVGPPAGRSRRSGLALASLRGLRAAAAPQHRTVSLL